MDDIIKKLELFDQELASLNQILKITEKKETVAKIQSQMAASDFWDDSNKASKIMAELKLAKADLDGWQELNSRVGELKDLLTIADSDYQDSLEKEVARLDADFESLRLSVLFSGKFDSSSAIVEINAGAGGTESCDWASMLYRMYFRFCQDKDFSLTVLDELAGDEAGIKSIAFFVEGIRAYGMLKAESGVHRLVRVSPFDANKRRHTSFASVSVLPDVKDDLDIEIKPEDLKLDTYRASGAGGQHVNKTESAVRLTHLPTKIVVSCQTERSQHQNRLVALRVLKAKLYELKEQEKTRELAKISGDKRKIEWGSQIRSYVLYPYLLIKDHRTNHQEHDANAVLDGKLDEFIYAYLKWAKM